MSNKLNNELKPMRTPISLHRNAPPQQLITNSKSQTMKRVAIRFEKKVVPYPSNPIRLKRPIHRKIKQAFATETVKDASFECYDNSLSYGSDISTPRKYSTPNQDMPPPDSLTINSLSLEDSVKTSKLQPKENLNARIKQEETKVFL